MPSICSSDPALGIYYGGGELEALARHRRVVLQPAHYGPAELARLAAGGTAALAYLALSEDVGPAAAWHRPLRNPWWGGRYVRVGHPGWTERTLRAVEEALEAGFAGLFLDTLDSPALFPDDREPLLELVARIRERAGGAYLVANRGFGLHPELAPLVDGFLFEGFSTTWIDGYRALPYRELLANVERLTLMQATGRELYALDYADTPELAAFARARAATHRLPCQVADRELTRLAGA